MPYVPDSGNYKFFRNVKDFGAKGKTLMSRQRVALTMCEVMVQRTTLMQSIEPHLRAIVAAKAVMEHRPEVP